jgi:hypothetical protein
MKQNLGGLAGLFAILALLYHTQSGSESPGLSPDRAMSIASKGQPTAVTDEPPSIEGPWLATRSIFPPRPHDDQPKGLDSPSLSDDEACKLGQFLGLPDRGVEMWSVVATVADPQRTRLSLFLDNQLE